MPVFPKPNLNMFTRELVEERIGKWSILTFIESVVFQVRNSKASGYCLDQGSEDDDKAILYPCHGMSSQVRPDTFVATVNRHSLIYPSTCSAFYHLRTRLRTQQFNYSLLPAPLMLNHILFRKQQEQRCRREKYGCPIAPSFNRTIDPPTRLPLKLLSEQLKHDC